MSFLKSLVDYEREDSPARRMRQRRFRLLRFLLAPVPRPLRILDIGGTEVFWRTMGLAGATDVHITTLNIDLPEPSRSPNLTALQGDARDLSQFADQSFDVAFSNSLIEHVGGLEDQRRLAREVQRVGKAFFVQTPNRDFPLEPHFLFPFFQHLPVRHRVYMLMHFNLGWIARTPDREEARRLVESVQLLDRQTFCQLFPTATIWEERLFGLVKSFVAYGGFTEAAPIAGEQPGVGRQGWTTQPPLVILMATSDPDLLRFREKLERVCGCSIDELAKIAEAWKV